MYKLKQRFCLLVFKKFVENVEIVSIVVGLLIEILSVQSSRVLNMIQFTEQYIRIPNIK